MMKKMIAMLMIAALCLTGFALAEAKTYSNEGLSFVYDTEAFDIDKEEVTDDNLSVVLKGKNEAWGATTITLELFDLDDDATFPTLDDYSGMVENGVEVQQGEWNGFADVLSFDLELDEGREYVFLVPVKDADDGEIEEEMIINVTITAVEDEETAMMRDDAISAVLDTLKVVDD